MRDKYLKGVDKKQVVSWALYDFANSAYTVLILSFVFPIYFKDVIAGNSMGDFYWGLIVSLSILIGGISAPIIGAIADHDQKRKSKFIIFTLLAVIGTAALYFTGEGRLMLACIIFIIANLFLELAQSLYDSFLPQISTKKNAGFISGLGWGLGYLGGIAAMLLLRPLYASGFEGSNELLYKLTFPLTALFFLIFALPSFLYIKEAKTIKKKVKDNISNIRAGFNNIWKTFREIKNHKNVFWFLIAFYFLNDALVTIFAFLPLYAKNTMNIAMSDILIIIIIVQIIGCLATILLGILSDKTGPKKIVLGAIILWIITVIILYFATTMTELYIVAVIAGLAVGSSQAVARSWLSRIIPYNKRSQFFGFNGFASKIAATTGPILFGTISVFAASQRTAMLVLIPFFVIAWIIFANVREK
jgi:UMF1 family MFS transporter